MRLVAIIFLSIVILCGAPNAQAAQKLISNDNRIKTLVYDASEVFRVVTRAGFQTVIELNNDETIDTISIGDSIGWQLTPAGRRIFIKPLHKSGITNMSVITNRRLYNFEVVATSSGTLNSSHSYVVNFYYPESGASNGSINLMPIMPEEKTRNSLRPVSSTTIPQIPTPRLAPAPVISAQLPSEAPSVSSIPAPMPTISYAPQNFNYKLKGPSGTAPLKVYDNGKSTYMQFAPNVKNVSIFAIGGDGAEYPLSIRSENGMAVVDTVAPKMAIKQDNEVVTIYNENLKYGQ